MAAQSASGPAARPTPTPAPTRFAAPVSRTLVGVAATTVVCAFLAHVTVVRSLQKQSRGELLADWAGLGAAHLVDMEPADLVLDSEPGARSFAAPDVPPGYAPNSRDHFAGWAQALLRDGRALAAGVIDAQGHVLACYPADLDVKASLRPPPTRGEAVVYSLPNSALGGPVQVAVTPVSRGAALPPTLFAWIVAPAKSVPIFPRGCVTLFVGGTGAAAVLTLWLASVHLRRQVFAPLIGLSRQIAAYSGRGPVELPVERGDEVGAVARKLRDLYAELARAEEHATTMQRSIDSLVQQQTRNISLQLRRAERDAETDPLTRLANRRFLTERLENIYREQLAGERNLAVVAIDVDNFKSLNDTEGHAVGDAVLAFLGELLRGSIRDCDVAARLGGDEFVLLLVGVSNRQATEVAQRIVRLFAQRLSVMGLRTPVTLSAGIAGLEQVAAANGADLLRQADGALYAAKRAGKNIVHVCAA